MTNQHIDINYDSIESVIDKIAIEKERIILQKEGKSVAALVPIEELEILQELDDLEDQLDIKAAAEAMKEPGIVSWEDFKLQLGL
jgi:PHD/YefM family antitoxin component YafN of YafNO toxin-antitoxin module